MEEELRRKNEARKAAQLVAIEARMAQRKAKRLTDLREQHERDRNKVSDLQEQHERDRNKLGATLHPVTDTHTNSTYTGRYKNSRSYCTCCGTNRKPIPCGRL